MCKIHRDDRHQLPLGLLLMLVPQPDSGYVSKHTGVYQDHRGLADHAGTLACLLHWVSASLSLPSSSTKTKDHPSLFSPSKGTYSLPVSVSVHIIVVDPP